MRLIQLTPVIEHSIVNTYSPACPIAYLPPAALQLLKRLAEVHLIMSSNTQGTLPCLAVSHQIVIISNYCMRRTATLYCTSIDILDNDSLLNIFRLYRPVILDEDEVDDCYILTGGEWSRERWWYKLVHVCRQWRSLILASPPHLGLCLVFTYRTPVARMLAHSPPLPLIIDHLSQEHDVTAKDEE